MTTMTMGGAPARPDGDRNLFLVLVSLIWVGIVTGFGTDSYQHIREHGLDYPLVVHVHAVTFVAWLALLTTQILHVRGGRLDLHRRLGVLGAALAGFMMVIGPAAAVVVDRTRYLATGRTPEFMAVQLGAMVGFAILVGAALLLRRDGASHKRLILLGTLLLSEAGFARFLNDQVVSGAGLTGIAAQAVNGYFFSDLIAVGVGAYDLIRRGRLYLAYLLGLALTFVLQALEVAAMHSPAWKAFSMHLIGY